MDSDVEKKIDLFRDWMKKNKIVEVECLIPDISGIARGKILPSHRFLRGLEEDSLRLPESIFTQTVTGEHVENSQTTHNSDRDVVVEPDFRTIRLVPWYDEPVAQVICDTKLPGTNAWLEIAPRTVLMRVLESYRRKNWEPVVAPETEFYLVEINQDPDYPLRPPKGLWGVADNGKQAYGIEAANQFDNVIEDIYDYCEASKLDVDTMMHEGGAAQLEFNFNHGNALDLADQVFLFKRTLRQAANKHGMHATFMAKPHQYQPGSAMHLHQSVIDVETGRNIFITKKDRDSANLSYFIGGLERYIPAGMGFFAPNINSYRRLVPYSDAPINVRWGVDNRTTGIRVPNSAPQNRRVENRVIGADANPYVAFAASLAAGYLGLVEKQTPGEKVSGDGYELGASLPRNLFEANTRLQAATSLRKMMGEKFVRAYREVKEAEYYAYLQVISSWERENLLLTV